MHFSAVYLGCRMQTYFTTLAPGSCRYATGSRPSTRLWAASVSQLSPSPRQIWSHSRARRGRFLANCSGVVTEIELFADGRRAKPTQEGEGPRMSARNEGTFSCSVVYHSVARFFAWQGSGQASPRELDRWIRCRVAENLGLVQSRCCACDPISRELGITLEGAPMQLSCVLRVARRLFCRGRGFAPRLKQTRIHGSATCRTICRLRSRFRERAAQSLPKASGLAPVFPRDDPLVLRLSG